MITGALPFLRNKGCFEVFYWTHLNYISFSIIYVLHASSALYWFLLPGLVFMTCKLQTILRFCLGTRSVSRLWLISNYLGYTRSSVLEIVAFQDKK